MERRDIFRHIANRSARIAHATNGLILVFPGDGVSPKRFTPPVSTAAHVDCLQDRKRSVENYPFLAELQTKTTRQIPLVILQRRQ